MQNEIIVKDSHCIRLMWHKRCEEFRLQTLNIWLFQFRLIFSAHRQIWHTSQRVIWVVLLKKNTQDWSIDKLNAVLWLWNENRLHFCHTRIQRIYWSQLSFSWWVGSVVTLRSLKVSPSVRPHVRPSGRLCVQQAQNLGVEVTAIRLTTSLYRRLPYLNGITPKIHP